MILFYCVSVIGSEVPMTPEEILAGHEDREGIAALRRAESPRGLWRPAEDRVVVAGNSLRTCVCVDA